MGHPVLQTCTGVTEYRKAIIYSIIIRYNRWGRVQYKPSKEQKGSKLVVWSRTHRYDRNVCEVVLEVALDETSGGGPLSCPSHLFHIK